MSPRLQGLDPLAHPLILAQDVPGTLAADRVEMVPVGLELLERHPREQELAAVRNLVPEKVRDAVALGAPLVVHAVGQPARGLGVAHHDRRRGLAQRQPVMDQGVAVEEQGMVGTAEEAGELVEQARADSDELILGR